MVKKVRGKEEWIVWSEDGKKKLGGPYKSKKKAEQRLEQVEYFKNRQRRQSND